MKNLIVIIVSISMLTSCSQSIYESVASNDNRAIYNEFWHHVHENYIYFREKEVNWHEVYDMYGSALTEHSSDQELFEAMEASLLQLKDTHNNLVSPLGRSRVHNYRAGYDIHFDLNVVGTNYINGNLEQANIFSYGNIDEATLYVHVPKMTAIPSLKALLRRETHTATDHIILDLRNNSGGNSNDVPFMLSDYVSEKTYLGGYIEKSGPSIDDTTEPIAIYAEPAADYNFDGKVTILINRVGYSATSYLAAMSKGLDNFTLVGQLTGGGGGGNAGYELSNGWVINISVSDFVDKEGKTIELGVTPDVKIENTADDIKEGRDVMLEKALSLR